jgi:hypothetical protein
MTEEFNIEEIEIEKIKNYADCPNLHCHIGQTYSLWNPFLLNEFSYNADSCRNCKSYYMVFSNKSICSGCDKKIKKEIDDFEKHIDDNYNVIQNRNGVNIRIKLIMFAHRNELMKDNFNPCSIYSYGEQLNLSLSRIFRLLRMIDNNLSCSNLKNINNFDSLGYGGGSFDKKLMFALKKGITICPAIFCDYKDLIKQLERKHYKQIISCP